MDELDTWYAAPLWRVKVAMNAVEDVLEYTGLPKRSAPCSVSEDGMPAVMPTLVVKVTCAM
jgi:hypothetical protein